MQEFFWFFLGGFVYLIVDKSISFYKKVKFLNDIKVLSFKEKSEWTLESKYNIGKKKTS